MIGTSVSPNVDVGLTVVTVESLATLERVALLFILPSTGAGFDLTVVGGGGAAPFFFFN